MSRHDKAEKNYLIGAVSMLEIDRSNSLVEISLKERVTRQSSTSAGPSNEAWLNHQSVHLIRFLGTWSGLIIDDLKMSSELKLYLNVYEPRSIADLSWEFHEGIRVELLIHNPSDTNQLSCFIKTIDVGQGFDLTSATRTGSRLSTDLSLPEQVRISSPTTDSRYLLQPTSQGRRKTRSLPRQRMKRPGTKRPVAVESHRDEDRTSDHNPPPPSEIPQGEILKGQLAVKRDRSGSEESLPQILHPRGDTHHRQTSTQLFATSDAPNRPYPAGPACSRNLKLTFNTQLQQDRCVKTLYEIEQMQGGPSQLFSVIAIIGGKRTEGCKQASRGTLDHKITVYLTDFSRPMGKKDVACNLFWKTAEECAVWAKPACDWKVLFLSNVSKSSSAQYPDQIVGRASFFEYGLWCPGNFYCSVPDIGQFSSLFLSTYDDINAKAVALYEQLKDRSGVRLPSRAALLPVQSVPKTISELEVNLDGKFDLCIEIVDIWVANGGNDRMTVTDYTANPALRMAKPDGATLLSSLPLPRFHRQHGGTCCNWWVTARRLMTVYLEPLVLKAIYQQFYSTDRSGNPSMRDYRTKLASKVVRLSQLDLRFADSNNRTNIYAIMAHSSRSRIDSHASLSDRIVPLIPAEPAFQKLQNEKENYHQAMKEFA